MGNWAAYQEQLVGLPVKSRHRNALHFARPDGLTEAHIVGKPAHFLNTANEWQAIDTALKPTGAEFGAPGIPIRFRTDGRVAVGTHVQRTNRIGLFNPITKTFSALATLPNGLIVGDTLIRESGIFREEIRLTEDGAREELIISSMPSGGSGDWLVIETRIEGGAFADGETAEFSREGYRFPRPSARDANGNPLPAKRFALKIGAAQYLLTGIPLAALAGAAFKVRVDPDFAGDVADGHIHGLNATYATARSTSSGLNVFDATRLLLGQFISDYYVIRAFLKFDTSSIGAGSTVTQVNLKMVVNNDVSTTDFDVNIIKQDWSAQDPLSDANRETAYDNCLTGTLDENIWRNTSGISTATQYTSGNLATAYVNKAAATYYSLISSRDLAGTAPTGDEYIWLESASCATAAYRPVLTVVYTTGRYVALERGLRGVERGLYHGGL